jgi:hypothetical protein
MAMTKKEQAAMQAAIDKAETLAALRWTEPVAKDVPPPEKGYTEGWEFNIYTKAVDPYWSSCIYHGQGPAPKDGNCYDGGRQNPRKLYSTKLLALMALRHEVEKEAATSLMRIDRLIEAEKGSA